MESLELYLLKRGWEKDEFGLWWDRTTDYPDGLTLGDAVRVENAKHAFPLELEPSNA